MFIYKIKKKLEPKKNKKTKQIQVNFLNLT